MAQVNGEAGINVDKDGGDNAMAMNQIESASVSFEATAERVCVLFTLLMFTSGSLLFEKLERVLSHFECITHHHLQQFLECLTGINRAELAEDESEEVGKQM
ncbi:hypothetical protein TURU_145351 [Turdus rufiventris]|nr:hypothetical protein TURU_145351 [Turdus rufiventris]